MAIKKLYFFEDTVNNDRVSFTYYDNKWREETHEISGEQRLKIKLLPKSKKFGYKVYVGTWEIFD